MKAKLISESKSVLQSNLLRRWHQLQLKLLCDEMQELQLVNWRHAGEEKRPELGKSSTICAINRLIDIKPIKRST